MKKIILSATLAAIVGTASLSAHADSGTITITGTVTAQTCQINPIGGGSAGNVAVELGTYPKSDLAAAGSSTAEKAFSLMVGGGADDCGANALTMKFKGANIDANGHLANSVAGTDAVAQLLDKDGQPMNLSTATVDVGVPDAAGTQVDLFARLYSATGNATAGDFESSVVVDLVQN